MVMDAKCGLEAKVPSDTVKRIIVTISQHLFFIFISFVLNGAVSAFEALWLPMQTYDIMPTPQSTQVKYFQEQCQQTPVKYNCIA